LWGEGLKVGKKGLGVGGGVVQGCGVRVKRMILMSVLGVSVAGAGEVVGRVGWRNERLRGSPEARPPMRAVRSYEGLAVKRPVFLEREPGSGRIWFVENYAWEEYRSVVKRFEDVAGVKEAEVLLEIPGDGELAYGLCFHPKFAENGYVYLGTNGKGPGEKHHSRIVRYTVGREAPWRIDEASRFVVIEWESNGHNGAAAVFGKDGMLYVTSGDGSANADALVAGQDTASWLSKVMRIDVDGVEGGKGYRVPGDNPFVGVAGVLPETWAYGLRNPWRITSDEESGQIWVGQNGQDLREYAHLLERGANYGWSEYEGSRVFQAGRLRGPAAFTVPTIEHGHEEFRSLTGGFVYRGEKFPELAGAYVYGDYGTGRVWAMRHDGEKVEWQRELADTSAAIAGFGTNGAGDILLADHLGNAVLRLERAGAGESGGAERFPRRLSETGLFAATASLTLEAGVHAYQLRGASWHDGAEGKYAVALPEGVVAEGMVAGDDAWRSWKFPDGSALVQTLTMPGVEGRASERVETRVLLKEGGDWAAYSWLWNEMQTDAELVPAGGVERERNGVKWRVPARSECVLCHGRGADYVLGMTSVRLNLEVEREGKRVNQLVQLAADGVVRVPGKDGKELVVDARAVREVPRMVDPHEEGGRLDERVRAYFAVNCSHCHRHEGGGNSRMDLSPWLTGESRHLIDEVPQHGGFGMPDARLIVPREPGRSVLPVRMSGRGAGQMPPVGTRVVDPRGLGLIYRWLASGADGP
jgi:glucose/arabinose dehydrogenase